MKIIKVFPLPQPRDPKYFWFYALADDGKMYVWHEQRGEWTLHQKNVS